MKNPESKLTREQYQVIQEGLDALLKRDGLVRCDQIHQIASEITRQQLSLQEEELTDAVLKKEREKKEAEEKQQKERESLEVVKDLAKEKNTEPKGVTDGPPSKRARNTA